MMRRFGAVLTCLLLLLSCGNNEQMQAQVIAKLQDMDDKLAANTKKMEMLNLELSETREKLMELQRRMEGMDSSTNKSSTEETPPPTQQNRTNPSDIPEPPEPRDAPPEPSAPAKGAGGGGDDPNAIDLQ